MKRKYKLTGFPTLNDLKAIGTAESEIDYQRFKKKARFYLRLWNYRILFGFLALILFGILVGKS